MILPEVNKIYSGVAQKASGWMLGAISPENMNIARNATMRPSGYENKLISKRQYAGRYSGLKEFGVFGNIPNQQHNREVTQKLQVLQDKLARVAPEAPGTFVLGSMQGARVRAWERRQTAKAQEESKQKLKRVETQTHTQQEAPNVERATTR